MVPPETLIDDLKRQLRAAEERERKWLDLAVSLARAKAPTWQVDGAWARHAQAQANTRFLVRRLASALLEPGNESGPEQQAEHRRAPAAGEHPDAE